jgi:PAS domain S-box-containing protein
MNSRILLIDDEEGIRFTFKSFLSEEGYDVDTAEDFEKALDCIRSTDFDLIFVDIYLKGKSGIDFLREAKERGIGCPIIMLTAFPNVDTVSEALRLGAFDYISKPVRKDTLVRIARVALQHKTLRDEKERYRLNLEATFRSVMDAIITMDSELRVIAINDAAEEICGFTNEAVGSLFSELPKRCDGRCHEILESTIRENRPVKAYRIKCRNVDRSEQVVTITTSPLLEGGGEPSGGVLVVRDETRLADLERDLKERRQFHNIVGKSEIMQEVYSLIEDLSDVRSTVLIMGESGTGKELVAEALHYVGGRGSKPLVKVNCSALPEYLLESELFGHVRGAFTGAVRDKVGRFEMADGGTIFLDEIADVSPRVQLRLLRVLQDMEFERVGDSRPIKVDVRIVAATNQDLVEKVRIGEFREDLFYRLKVVVLVIPSLRDRKEDIPILVDHFIKKFNKKFEKHVDAVSEDVIRMFMQYAWPGNIRELEHTMEHAFILCRQNVITVQNLPLDFNRSLEDAPVASNKTAVLEAIKRANGKKARAARLLGISRSTLYRKIEEYGIDLNKRDET